MHLAKQWINQEIFTEINTLLTITILFLLMFFNLILNAPRILALAAETGFLLFKNLNLKFKKEISAVRCERKTFRLISLSTPVSFRWTVPLRQKHVLIHFHVDPA